MRDTRTQSSISGVPITVKVAEWLKQLRYHWQDSSPFADRDFSWLADELARFDDHAWKRVGKPLADCRTLEIGFGPRPYRLLGLHAAGVDVVGCDIDSPVLSSRDLLTALRVNGYQRALKSAVRYFSFDVAENRKFKRFLSQEYGQSPTFPRERLVVADAASKEFWNHYPGPYDFIYSDDVFEHISHKDVRFVAERLANALSADGLALISPMIWTGIKGGHYVEYYDYQGGQPPSGPPPWAHLRTDQYPVNTYLNHLTRCDYRKIFGEFLDIVDEEEIDPGLGQELLTPELRSELGGYSDEELLSNKVSFVMRRRR